MPYVVLTTADVEHRLKELQDKYGLSNEEFQNSERARCRVSDQDEFDWDVYLEHQAALREEQETLHRDYLRRLVSVEQSTSNSAEYFAGVAA
ncbi:MAG: hypothetical protein ACM3JB_23725 [Acidobacteriaceae bacterium]